MGRKSGITKGSYDPRISKMQWVMAQREMVREQEYVMMNKKKMRGMYWNQRLANAIDLLRTTDKAGWERWYDDDNNVPDNGNEREWALLVEARVVELTGGYPVIKCQTFRGIYIWQDALGVYVYSKEVSVDRLYIIEQDSLEAAKSFVMGLPLHNCGYGVVLDIVPVSALASVAVEKV
jgi:hypothetical protein